MVRSSRTDTLLFDPEIEKTARQLRQQTKRAKQRSSSPLLSETDTVPNLVESSSDSEMNKSLSLNRLAKTVKGNEFCRLLELNDEPLTSNG